MFKKYILPLLVLIAILAVGFVVGVTTPSLAQKATENKAYAYGYSGYAGWADWLMPTGTICLETNGSTVLAAVAAEWNKSDADIVGQRSCMGYSRNMTVKYVVVDKPTDPACAWSGSDSGWTRQNVRGMSTLTPNGPTVWLNKAASYSGCRATSSMVKHVWSHEFGHILGLAHNSEPSIMAQGEPYGWDYNSPTVLDIWRVNYRY